MRFKPSLVTNKMFKIIISYCVISIALQSGIAGAQVQTHTQNNRWSKNVQIGVGDNQLNPRKHGKAEVIYPKRGDFDLPKSKDPEEVESTTNPKQNSRQTPAEMKETSKCKNPACKMGLMAKSMVKKSLSAMKSHMKTKRPDAAEIDPRTFVSEEQQDIILYKKPEPKNPNEKPNQSQYADKTEKAAAKKLRRAEKKRGQEPAQSRSENKRVGDLQKQNRMATYEGKNTATVAVPTNVQNCKLTLADVKKKMSTLKKKLGNVIEQASTSTGNAVRKGAQNVERGVKRSANKAYDKIVWVIENRAATVLGEKRLMEKRLTNLNLLERFRAKKRKFLKSTVETRKIIGAAIQFGLKTARDTVYKTLRISIVVAVNAHLPFIGGILAGFTFDMIASQLVYGAKYLCKLISNKKTRTSSPAQRSASRKAEKARHFDSIMNKQKDSWSEKEKKFVSKHMLFKDYDDTLEDCQLEMLRNQESDFGQWKRLKIITRNSYLLKKNNKLNLARGAGVDEKGKVQKSKDTLYIDENDKVQKEKSHVVNNGGGTLTELGLKQLTKEYKSQFSLWKKLKNYGKNLAMFVITVLKDSLNGFGEFGLLQQWIETDKDDLEHTLKVTNSLILNVQTLLLSFFGEEGFSKVLLKNLLKKIFEVATSTFSANKKAFTTFMGKAKACYKFNKKDKEKEKKSEEREQKAVDKKVGMNARRDRWEQGMNAGSASQLRRRGATDGTDVSGMFKQSIGTTVKNPEFAKNGRKLQKQTAFVDVLEESWKADAVYTVEDADDFQTSDKMYSNNPEFKASRIEVMLKAITESLKEKWVIETDDAEHEDSHPKDAALEALAAKDDITDGDVNPVSDAFIQGFNPASGQQAASGDGKTGPAFTGQGQSVDDIDADHFSNGDSKKVDGQVAMWGTKWTTFEEMSDSDVEKYVVDAFQTKKENFKLPVKGQMETIGKQSRFPEQEEAKKEQKMINDFISSDNSQSVSQKKRSAKDLKRASERMAFNRRQPKPNGRL